MLQYQYLLGWFNFIDDLEGVLTAVWGKDKSNRSIGSNSASKNSVTPELSTSLIKNKSRDLDSSFMSVSTSSPISSASKNMRKDSNKYETDNRKDTNDRRNMRHNSMLSEMNKHYVSQY